MVGKSRGSRHGEARTTTGGAAGGGTVGVPQEGEINAQQQETIADVAQQIEEPREQSPRSHMKEEDILNSGDAEAITASMDEIEGVVPDLSGRGTPGGKISELAKGERPGQDEIGLGAGGHNLGMKHGRTAQGGDIAGAGASIETTRKKDAGQQYKED
jgi:hypothetical protein